MNNPTKWINQIRDSSLPSVSKLIAFELRTYLNDKTEIAFPSLKKLCDKTSLSRPTISKHLLELQSAGFLDIQSGDRVKSNRYKILFPALKVGKEVSYPRKGDCLQVGKEVTKGRKGALLEVGKEVSTIKQSIKQTNKQRERESSKKTDDPLIIFEYWKKVFNKTDRVKFDDKRKRSVKKSLKVYSVDEIKKAIDGCAGSEFNIENGFTDIELITRNNIKTDSFIEKYERAGQPEEKPKSFSSSMNYPVE